MDDKITFTCGHCSGSGADPNDARCCCNFTKYGECCNNPIQVYEPCPECLGMGIIEQPKDTEND